MTLIKWHQFKKPSGESGWVGEFHGFKLYRWNEEPAAFVFKGKLYEIECLPKLLKIISEDFIMKS